MLADADFKPLLFRLMFFDARVPTPAFEQAGTAGRSNGCSHWGLTVPQAAAGRSPDQQRQWPPRPAAGRWTASWS